MQLEKLFTLAPPHGTHVVTRPRASAAPNPTVHILFRRAAAHPCPGDVCLESAPWGQRWVPALIADPAAPAERKCLTLRQHRYLRGGLVGPASPDYR